MSKSARFELAEVALTAAAAPLLLFPRGLLPWLGLCLAASAVLVRRSSSGRWLTRTPLDRPIAIIFLMTLVSLYPSVDLDVSLVKFYGILLSFFVFYATVQCVSNERRFWLGVGLLLIGTVVVSLVGAVGTDWGSGKGLVPQSIYGLIPRLITRVTGGEGAAICNQSIYVLIPGVITRVQASQRVIGGFNPNEVGGSLASLLPLPFSLLLQRTMLWKWRVVLAATGLLGVGVLTLSASRSAFAAIVVASLYLLVLRRRLRRGALLVTALIMIVFAFSWFSRVPLDLWLKFGAIEDLAAESLHSRLDIWNRAVYMIESHPFTGIGLNTFPVILNALYPTFLRGPTAELPHAHNILLQTAVDLGLGGLLGFLALCGVTVRTGWQSYKHLGARKDTPLQAAVAGLLAGLLAYLIFGLADAITLGAKPSILLWVMLGLVVAAGRIGEPVRRSLGNGIVIQARTIGAPYLILAERAYWILTYALVALGVIVIGVGLLGSAW